MTLKKIIIALIVQLTVCVSVMAYDEVGCRIHVVRVDEKQEQSVPVLRSQKYEKIALERTPCTPYLMGAKSFAFESADESRLYSYRVNIRLKVKNKASSWSFNGDKLEVEAILYELPDNKVVAVSTGHIEEN